MIENAKRIAVLIHHPDDIFWVRNRFKEHPMILVHENYIRFFMDEKNEIKSFRKVFLELDYDNIDFLLTNWYRDINGKDIYFHEDISWAQVITSTLFHSIATIYREYSSLKHWVNLSEYLYVSENEDMSFKSLLKYFPGKVELYNPGHSNKSIIPSSNERVLVPNDKKNLRYFLIYFLRVLQGPFMGLLRNRIIFFYDWTSQHQVKKRKDALSTRVSLNIFRSAYILSVKKFEADAEIPKSLYPVITSTSLAKVLKRINVEWDPLMLDAISGHINSKYIENRAYFFWQYVAFKDMLNYYQPAKVVLPHETYEPYTIMLHMARSREIETVYLLDGLFSTICASHDSIKALRFRDSKNEAYLFNTIIASGTSNYDYFKRFVDGNMKVILVRPPILDMHKRTNLKKEYEIILMTHTANDLNPAGHNGSRLESLREMLSVAREVGYKNIAIKIKNDSELTWVALTVNNLGMTSMCEIISGYFYEHIDKAKVVVCGFSTAVLETAYHKIPCIVYEPYSNGYTDANIKASLSVNHCRVARTTDELHALLLSGVSSLDTDPSYLFCGPELSKVNL